MPVPITKAIVAEMRDREAREPKGGRAWFQVVVGRRDDLSLRVDCIRCRRPRGCTGTGTSRRVVRLWKAELRIEGWLEVECYLGECPRCRTVYWG